MLNREFEKQVQDKMGELQFSPSAPVWTNIEKVIRKKKERRRILFWLPLLAIGLGGGIWWTLQEPVPVREARAGNEKTGIQSEPGTVPFDQSSTRQRNTPKENPSSPIITATGTTLVEKSQVQAPATSNQVKTPAASDTGEGTGVAGGSYVPDRKGTINKSQQAEDPGTGSGINSTPDLPKERRVQNSNKGVRFQATPGKLPARPISIPDSSRMKQEEKKKDTGVLKAFVQSTPEPSTGEIPAGEKKDAEVTANVETESSADSAGAVTVAAAGRVKEEGWKLAAVISTGVATVNKGFSFGSVPPFEARYASAPTFPSGNLQASDRAPSPVYSGLSFAAGLLAQKELTESIHFTTGLEYRYYSTSMDVGLRFAGDTAVKADKRVHEFYTKDVYPESIGRYTNAYHFLTIPVTVDVRLSRKVPISLQTGLSLQKLISSDGLVYSNKSQIYYEDRKALEGMQVFTRFGLYYTFSIGKRTPITIGPELTYALKSRQLIYDSEERLFSAGITTRIGLNKKFF